MGSGVGEVFRGAEEEYGLDEMRDEIWDLREAFFVVVVDIIDGRVWFGRSASLCCDGGRASYNSLNRRISRSYITPAPLV